MIYVSLEKERIKISDRQKITRSLQLIMPLIFEINRTVNRLGMEHNVSCNVYVKIADAISLEVKNDRQNY